MQPHPYLHILTSLSAGRCALVIRFQHLQWLATIWNGGRCCFPTPPCARTPSLPRDWDWEIVDTGGLKRTPAMARKTTASAAALYFSLRVGGGAPTGRLYITIQVDHSLSERRTWGENERMSEGTVVHLHSLTPFPNIRRGVLGGGDERENIYLLSRRPPTFL